MTTAYLVTHGDYSAYGYDHAFATKEAALAYIELIGEKYSEDRAEYGAYGIDELPLLDSPGRKRDSMQKSCNVDANGPRDVHTSKNKGAEIDGPLWGTKSVEASIDPWVNQAGEFLVSVRAYGWADLVPKVYSETVARVRAEWDIYVAKGPAYVSPSQR